MFYIIEILAVAAFWGQGFSFHAGLLSEFLGPSRRSPVSLFMMQKGQVIGPWYVDKVVLNERRSIDGKFVDFASFRSPATSTYNIRSSNDSIVRYEPEILMELRGCLSDLIEKFWSDDGHFVDYKSMTSSQKYHDYLRIAESFCHLDLQSLTIYERKSLFINIYNCLSLNAINNGYLEKEADYLERMKFLASASYNINGMIFSLNEIKHGVLRGNSNPARLLAGVPFPDPADPRRAFILDNDHRVHFALSCGTLSGPAIRAYSSDERILNTELNLATEQYLDKSVHMDLTSRSVILPAYFSWYRNDFGGSDSAILNWVVDQGSAKLKGELEDFESEVRDRTEFLQNPRFGNIQLKIKFSQYDWRLNIKQ